MIRSSHHTVNRLLRLCAAGALLLAYALTPPAARASSVRWMASRPTFTNEAQPVAWYRNDLTYFVDNGPLNSAVSNSTATAMVAAAAAVWNIQYSNLTLQQGGSLAEDVSSANVYLGTDGPIWPADVTSTNYTSIPIAVVFDADGTITDLLLGEGSSAPASCRQNAVTESVDLFIQPGSIAHAVIILNGRCVGAAPEQLLQMQYQLMRVFGRVLGLGWSQVNDNVFTGAPQPTYQQQLHWPILHAIDIVCGTYTYQCLPDPFTLRDDDRSSLRLLYGVSIYTFTDGEYITGNLLFPDGSGMNGVNLVATRAAGGGTYGTEPWQTASALTGYVFHGNQGNPVTGAVTAFPALQGTWFPPQKGLWAISSVPVIGNDPWDNVILRGEPINPLYSGPYALGPFTQGPILPSGSPEQLELYVVGRYSAAGTGYNVVPDAASDCSTGNDGTASAPAAVPAGGIWTGRLCGYGHSSYGTLNVQAGRTATLEVMALDETGAASTGKVHPMLGMWHGAAASGLPNLIQNPAPFNGRQVGTSQVKPLFTTAEPVTFVIADERGEGRPDFTYAARLLYADSASPAQLNAGGGAIRILGTGFEPGNAVTIGGVLATVISLTSTEIDAVAPPLGALGNASSYDVTVTDLRTGGTTTILGGLTYGGASTDQLVVVTAPAALVNTGVPSTLSVRLTTGSGTPEAGTAVTFTVPSGSALYNTCSLSTCTVNTDSTGLATVQVTATYAGAITLQAAVLSGASVTVQTVAQTVQHAISALRSPEYVAAAPGAVFNPAVEVVNNGGPAPGVPVAWSVVSGALTLGAPASNTDGSSVARVTALGNLAAGDSAQLQACAWTTTCVTLSVIGVGLDALVVTPVSGDGQVVPVSTSLAAVQLRVTDGQGHGVAGATVQLYQAAYGWQPACPATGRCATPPLYGTSTSTAVTDDDGNLTLQPLQYTGAATVTRVVATAGTSGYLAFTLTRTP